MKRVCKRIFSVVLALTVAVGSVCWRSPKAKAVVIDATAAFGAAAAAAAVNGTTATTLFTGMGTSAATSSMIGLMDTYAVATGVAASGTALASTIATGILVAGGTLLVGAAAAALIGGFIDWLREEKGLEAGGPVLPILSNSVGTVVIDGSTVRLSVIGEDGSYSLTGISAPLGGSFSIGNCSYSISGQQDTNAFYTRYDVVNGSNANWDYWLTTPKTNDVVNVFPAIFEGDSSYLYAILQFKDGSLGEEGLKWLPSSGGFTQTPPFSNVTFQNEEFSLQPNSEFQEIPAAIPEGQILSIDIGLSALPQDDPQAAADAIMQSAIDGALDPSVSVVTDPTVTPDPDPGTDPEPGGAETTSWLSRILESIKSLPQKIAEAISSIFVPSPDFFPTAISNLRDAYSDRMGLLTYPISVLFDFLDRILNLNNQQPILRWDNIYLPWYSGRPVVAAGQYNLNDTLSTTAGRRVHDVYLVIVDAMMIVAFLDLCRRKYQKIIHN